MPLWLIYFFYTFLMIVWVIYSYTQIDLNLTLISNPLYQYFQNQLIQLGYFQRPTSAGIFLLLLIIWYLFYLWILSLVKNHKIQFTTIKWLIGISLFLILAYPAFSHDIFNYMFDARVVTKYHLSPYFFKALDFPDDSWTRFMHWTHRYYPYGPIWLYLSLIPSFLGFGKFILTLGLFKLMFVLFYLLCGYLIFKILGKTNKESIIFGLSIFLLNPLVLIEGIISPHNEIIMLFFVLASLYLLILNKYIFSIVMLILSIGVKFVSLIFLPIYFITNNLDKIIKWGFWLWSLLVIYLFTQREPYAWYILPLIGLSSLFQARHKLQQFTIILSMCLLVRYWPYLLYGEYKNEVYLLQTQAMLVIFILGYLATWRIFKNS